jgi:N-terminal domain of cytochrome oxidase-cbb3, FixP
LAAEKQEEIDAHTGTATTGHEWDGIKELNTPLPRWWLNTFYACIIWAIGYWLVYPAWPLLTGYTQGMFQWHSRAAVSDDLKELTTMCAAMNEKLAAGGRWRRVRDKLRTLSWSGWPRFKGLSQSQRRPLDLGWHACGHPDHHRAWRAVGRRP